jgi:hypothetical protein
MIAYGEGGWAATSVGLNGCAFVRANDGLMCRSDRGMNILNKIGSGGVRR